MMQKLQLKLGRRESSFTRQVRRRRTRRRVFAHVPPPSDGIASVEASPHVSECLRVPVLVTQHVTVNTLLVRADITLARWTGYRLDKHFASSHEVALEHHVLSKNISHLSTGHL